jgi:predicted DsbA family dithiol-disulfide isomerase
MTPLRIDFIADVVCPWCWLGWRRLNKALALRPEVESTVLWRAYQLDPGLPEEGVDRAAAMAAKFPDPERRRALGEALVAEAAKDGAVLNNDLITRSPNTNAAHRVIRWAQGFGRGPAAVEATFAAYFTAGRDLGDPMVLADIGAAAGLDPGFVLGRLAEDLDREAVAAEHQAAWREGVTSVPFMIFDGRLSVMGAQPPERLGRVIDTALRERAA